MKSSCWTPRYTRRGCATSAWLHNSLESSAADQLLVGNPKLPPGRLDVAKKSGAISIISGRRRHVGHISRPERIESAHQRFAEIFAQHRRQGNSHAMGFAFFTENDSDHVRSVAEAVIAVAVVFAQDFQRPLVEHEPQVGAIMFPATLAIAENGE